MVDAPDLAALQALLHKLNPGAKQLVGEHGSLDVREVLATGRFDFERAASTPGWLAVMRGDESSAGHDCV